MAFTTHSNVGVTRLYGQGKFAEALLLAGRSVARARTLHGEKGMEFATAASLLGMVYQAQGRYAEAEPLHRRALAIYEITLGREHSVVTTPLNAPASLYEDRDRHADAEPLHRRSLGNPELKDIKFRIGSMERGQVALRDAMVQQNMKLDRHGARLEKIESVWAS